LLQPRLTAAYADIAPLKMARRLRVWNRHCQLQSTSEPFVAGTIGVLLVGCGSSFYTPRLLRLLLRRLLSAR
jgi:hypothetical protein